MAEYFVATSGGSDSNDGLDIFGFGLSTASWTASTKRIVQASAFPGAYVWESGDRIYLSHASITDGLYEIAAKIDNSTIELVDSISGSDQTNVASSDGPWATVTKAVGSVAPGDRTYLCVIVAGEKFDSEASYPVTFNVDGTEADGFISWTGANSHGISNGTVATIRGNTTDSTIQSSSTSDRNIWQYIAAENGTNGWDVQTPQYGVFWRCEARDNTVDGFNNNAHFMTYVECLAEDQSGTGSHGIHLAAASGIDTHILGCVSRDNGDTGFYCADSDTGANAERTVMFGCIAYNTPGSTPQNDGFKRPRLMMHCVASNHSDDGISFENGHLGRMGIVINSLFVDNQGYGIDDEAGREIISLNNGFDNNTSGEVRNTPYVDEGRISLSEDPFVNQANDNFTLSRLRGGLFAQTRGNNAAGYKKPTNLIDFEFNDTDWTVGGNWIISDGVVHHSSGDNVQLEYAAELSIIDDVDYEVIYTVSNYIQGSVKVRAGNTSGTTRSADGTYREVLAGSQTDANKRFSAMGLAGFTIFPIPDGTIDAHDRLQWLGMYRLGEAILQLNFLPNDATPAQFEADIENVFISRIHSSANSGTRFNTQPHIGVSMPKDRLTKSG